MYLGYRIVYTDGSAIWKKDNIRWGRVLLLATACFAAFYVLTNQFWTEGSQILQKMIYPMDLQETKAALHDLAASLRAGESLSDAVYVFCEEILVGAKYPG